MCRGDRKLRAVLERAVLDKLSIDAAISGVVNVLFRVSVSVKQGPTVVCSLTSCRKPYPYGCPNFPVTLPPEDWTRTSTATAEVTQVAAARARFRNTILPRDSSFDR